MAEDVSFTTALPDFTVSTNADWPHESFTVKDGNTPMSLMGCTLRMQMRATPTARVAALDLAAPSLGITVNDEAGGTFSIYVPAATMSLVAPGTYVRDILISRNDETIYAGRGSVTVLQGITR